MCPRALGVCPRTLGVDHTDISSPILDGGEGCVVGGEDGEADAVTEEDKTSTKC